MLTDFLLASAHHILILAIVASLTAELVLLRAPLNETSLRRLTVFDAIYGGSALLMIIIGVLRVLYGLKGWEFYVDNHAFWTKMGLFAAMGLLSIRPTMAFGRWRKAAASKPGFSVPEAEISGVKRFLHLQTLLLVLIPVTAAAMARSMG